MAETEISGLAQRLCKRRFSVGADGLLLLNNSEVADLKMRTINADGSEAEFCGNGVRCFVKYCYDNNILRKDEVKIETLAGIKEAWPIVENDKVEKVKVNMGRPILEREGIPMLGQGTCVNEDLEIDGEKFEITCLSVGVPHCCIFVEDVNSFPVQEIGPKIERHNIFPNKTNVDFIQVLKKDEVWMRVWERGVGGETFACGTGACAGVVAGNLLHKISSKSTVHMIGGDLEIENLGEIFMTGPAEKAYEGTYN